MRVRLTEHRAGVTARRGIDRRPTLWRRLGLPLLAWSAIVLLGCGEGLLAQDQTQQLMQRAEELYQAGRYAESREKANFAVQRAPENPRALFLRGRAALAMGDATVALQDLTTAQKLDPTLGFAANRPAFEQSLQQAETQAGPGAVSPPATPPAGTPPADLQAPPPAGGTAPTTPGTPSQPGMPNATATPGAAAPGAAPGTAPGTPPGTPPAALPTTPAVPAPTGDPVVDALRTPGSQVLDFAQPPAFTPEQTAALENLFTLPPSRRRSSSCWPCRPAKIPPWKPSGCSRPRV